MIVQYTLALLGYVFTRLVNCVPQLAKRLFTTNYISLVRLPQICREAYLFNYYCVC